MHKIVTFLAWRSHQIQRQSVSKNFVVEKRIRKQQCRASTKFASIRVSLDQQNCGDLSAFGQGKGALWVCLHCFQEVLRNFKLGDQNKLRMGFIGKSRREGRRTLGLESRIPKAQEGTTVKNPQLLLAQTQKVLQRINQKENHDPPADWLLQVHLKQRWSFEVHQGANPARILIQMFTYYWHWINYNTINTLLNKITQ